MPTRIINGLSYLRPGEKPEKYTFPVGQTTPDVSMGTVWFTATGATVSITNFINGENGKPVYICSVSASVTTLVHGTNIFLSGSANYVMGSNDCIHLMNVSGNWIQIGGSGAGGGGAASGAPTDGPYITFGTNGTLSNERVLTAGTNVTITTSGSAVFISADTGAGGSGTPGGSNTQIQFNDSSSFGGDSQFTWDKTNDVLNVNSLDWTGGKVIYLDSSDSLQTAVLSASAGDTIVLAAGSYLISSGIVCTKSVHIVGQGPMNTVISSTTASYTGSFLWDQQADNFSIKNLMMSRDSGGSCLRVGSANNPTITGEQILIENIYIRLNAHTGSPAAIRLQDAGATIINPRIYVYNNSATGSSQSFGIFREIQVTSDNTYLRVFNPFVSITQNSGETNTISRCIMTFANGNYLGTHRADLYNPILIGRAPTNAKTEVLEMQGVGVDCHVYGGFLDGGSGGDISNYADLRISDSANVIMYGTVLANNTITDNDTNTDFRRGAINCNTIVMNSMSAPAEVSTPTTATQNRGSFTYTGGMGANNTVQTTGTAGGGAVVTMVLGNGASCTRANTNATAGFGGAFRFTAGNGGTQLATSGTNIGGNGGDFIVRTGKGGGATDGTTNRGGRGGNVLLITGSGGSGSTSTGSDGNVYLATETDGKSRGRVFFGVSDGNASGQFVVRGAFEMFSIGSNITTSGMGGQMLNSANTFSVAGFGGDVTITTTANIAAGFPGQLLFLRGSNASNLLTFQDEINLPGSGVDLNGYNLTIDTATVALLVYANHASKWLTLADNRPKPRMLEYSRAAVANTGAGEDDLSLYTLPADTLDTNGHSVEYYAFGTFGSTNTTKRVKMYLGSHVIYDTGQYVENSGCWTLHASIVRQSNTSQDIIARYQSSTTYGTLFTVATLNLSSSITLKCTGSSQTSTFDEVYEQGHRIIFYPNVG